MGKLNTNKLTRSHTSMIEPVEALVKQLIKKEEVTKISLGMITPGLPSGQHRVKCLPITGGLKVVVRGTRSKQEIFVYTVEASKVEQFILNLY